MLFSHILLCKLLDAYVGRRGERDCQKLSFPIEYVILYDLSVAK